MKYIVLLVHGINVWRPGRTIGKLDSFFEANGIPCVIVYYTFTGILGSRWKNPKIAKRIAEITKNIKKESGTKIIAVGHSNGCAILHLATKDHAAHIDYLVYLNPALKRTFAPGVCVKHCDVYHSPHDLPVKMSKWFSKVVNKISEKWFNARPWGEMGAKGYKGTDKRMCNFNKEKDFLVHSETHSDMFRYDKIAFYGPKIVGRILRISSSDS